MSGSDHDRLPSHDERRVLTLLRGKGRLSGAGIAQATGLSEPSVATILRELDQKGLVEGGAVGGGEADMPVGPIRLSPGGANFFGLKVGRRSMDLLLLDFAGEVRGRTHLAHTYPTPQEVLDFTLASVETLRGQVSPAQAERIAGLGIAMPFRLWDWTAAIGASPEDIRQWQSRDIRKELSDALDYPVYLQNDGSAACGGELLFGAGPTPRDFLHFFIGYYVGGGLVLDGQLFEGRTGNAAALGSLPIPALGGAHLQLVDVASLSVLEEMLAGQGAAKATLWNDPSAWDIRTDLVDDWIRDASAGLAYAIAASVCVIDCDTVLIDGWLPQDIRARLVTWTNRALRGLDFNGIEIPKVHPGTVGPDGRALGAAGLPMSERFLVNPGRHSA